MNYKKLAIWFGIPLVMIVFWVLAVYLPMDAGAKKKQNMINSILRERKDMEMSIMSMSQQIQTQAGLKKSYNDFLNQTPPIDKMPGFIGSLVRDARSKGMAVERLNGYYSSMDMVRKGIVAPVFEMGLKGGFLDMGKFLEEISQKTAFKGIQKARIAYDDRDNTVLAGRFVIEFKALKGRPGEGK
jgi:hypothetical protein